MSELATVLNVPLRFEPTPFTAAMIAMAIPVAMAALPLVVISWNREFPVPEPVLLREI
ncbi:hypothetical protein [Bradyrhizobium embrapense]